MKNDWRLEGEHKLGAGIIALHWVLGYLWDRWSFKLFAYPALGAITALFLFGLHLRKAEQDELASDAFFAAIVLWAATFLLLGWVPADIA